MKNLLIILLFFPVVSFGQYKSLDELTEDDAAYYLKLEGHGENITRRVEANGIVEWSGRNANKVWMSYKFFPESLGGGLSNKVKTYLVNDDEINVQKWINRLPSSQKLYNSGQYNASSIDESNPNFKKWMSIGRKSKPYYGNLYMYILKEGVKLKDPPDPNTIGFETLDGGGFINFINQDTFDLRGMITTFMLDYYSYYIPKIKKYSDEPVFENLLKGDVANIQKSINISFNQLEKGVIAIALGKDDDSKVDILVNPDLWRSFNDSKKFYIIYHELGHDLFNFNHGNGGKMMYNYADKKIGWEDFMSDRINMFESYIAKLILEE